MVLYLVTSTDIYTRRAGLHQVRFLF